MRKARLLFVVLFEERRRGMRLMLFVLLNDQVIAK